MTRCGAIAIAICLVGCGKNDAASETDAGSRADAQADVTIADARADADADAQEEADTQADAGADGEADAQADADAAADAGADADAGTDADACAPPLTSTSLGGACAPLVQSWNDEGHTHEPEGTDLHYCTEPPSSGNHYPFWANYTTYDRPIAKGYLVHALEHGAVVITYQCATSCPDIAAQLQAVIDAHPLDPICDGTIKSRLILAPDPTLDVAVAAAAWTWTYRATCVDTSTLSTFINAHYGQGTEATCAAGITPP